MATQHMHRGCFLHSTEVLTSRHCLGRSAYFYLFRIGWKHNAEASHNIGSLEVHWLREDIGITWHCLKGSIASTMTNSYMALNSYILNPSFIELSYWLWLSLQGCRVIQVLNAKVAPKYRSCLGFRVLVLNPKPLHAPQR